MSQIKCPKCHKSIDSGENFCPHCGYPLKKEPAAPENTCPECGHQNPPGTTFCEQCGAPLKPGQQTKQAPVNKTGPKVLHSTGTYTGTMAKGKTSRSWKIFKYVMFIIILIAIVAFVVWFKTDPNAKETMGNVLFGGVLMLIFAFFIWRKSRKGGRKRKARPDWDDDDNETIVDSDNDDDNDFDDSED